MAVLPLLIPLISWDAIIAGILRRHAFCTCIDVTLRSSYLIETRLKVYLGGIGIPSALLSTNYIFLLVIHVFLIYTKP